MQVKEVTPNGVDVWLERATKELIAEGFSPSLQTAFAAQGYRAPMAQWAPDVRGYMHPLISGFALACNRFARGDGRLRAKDLEVGNLAEFQDWLMLLDVESAGTEFRYIHYGHGIADLRGLSMQGRTTSYFSGHISRFFAATYRAVLARKERLLTVHEPPKRVFVENWHRLIVPLFDEAGQDVVRLAVLNVPDNVYRAGLEAVPDPVLIADRDLHVRFANRAARETFGQTAGFGRQMDLFGFAGLDFQVADEPEELAQKGAVRDVICLAVHGCMIQRYLVTVTGLLMRRRAFYLMTLRPAFEAA